MRRFTRHLLHTLMVFALLLVVGVVVRSPKVDAACAAPTTDYGSVTSSVSVSAAGNYRVWSRMQIPNSTSNNYLLEVDGGSCYTVGGNGSLAANTWVWVGTQSGGSNLIVNLSAGTHSLKMIGTSDGVLLDRVILTQDTACIPSNTVASDGTVGGNCANPPDTTNPATNVTAPTNGSTVSGTTTITANATDDTAIKHVEFYLDGTTLIGTDTTSPYSVSWNTTTASNGTHTITSKAYDTATPSNTATSSSVSVTVQNGQASYKVQSVTKTPSPMVVGQPVTFSVTFINQGTIAGVPGNVVLKLDGTTIGTVNSSTSLAASTSRSVNIPNSWTATAGSHTITATVGSDTFTEPFALNASDTTPPVVSITAPAANSTVSGAVTLTATATDSGTGVSSVVFKVNGSTVAGTVAKSGSTYTISWNSASVANGSKPVITAIATDGQGNSTTSSSVTVTASNQVTTKPGDINNDGKVNGIDISVVLTNWLGTGKSRSQGDLTGEGTVNGIDLSMVISNWSP